MNLLAIDPGSTDSAYVVIDQDSLKPLAFKKVPNEQLLMQCYSMADAKLVDGAAIETVASYGMAVGASVFDTCWWAGRFHEALASGGMKAERIFRREVKLHICGQARAKDANVRMALVDRFGGGASNGGKGSKGSPGFFYGFSADVWQAYALGVYVAEVTFKS